MWGIDKDDSLLHKAKCTPRTIPFSLDVELEESVLRSVSHDTELYIDGILDYRGELDPEGKLANFWDSFIKDMADDVKIYRDGVHMDLVTRRINGVQPRLSWQGKYNVLIVTFDITNLGAQVAGYFDGVIHQYPDCIQK